MARQPDHFGFGDSSFSDDDTAEANVRFGSKADARLAAGMGGKLTLGNEVQGSLRELSRRFLRQVVPDPARDRVMLIFSGEPGAVGFGWRMARTVCVALHRDRWNADRRAQFEAPCYVSVTRVPQGAAGHPLTPKPRRWTRSALG